MQAFAFLTNQRIDVAGYGCVQYDIGYGGAFYALADVVQFGLDLCKSPIQDIIAAGSSLTEAMRRSVSLSHPESEDLAFLYGSILTDGRDEYSEEDTANICIFADCLVLFNTHIHMQHKPIFHGVGLYQGHVDYCAI